MLTYILGLVLTGLVVGALGRLAIPGPNPMSVGMTILVGVGGSLLAGLLAGLLLNRAAGLLLSVLGAALIVWLMQRNQDRRLT